MNIRRAARSLSADKELNMRTPELVSVRFDIAGLGSRFAAIVADMLIMYLIVLVMILISLILMALSDVSIDKHVSFENIAQNSIMKAIIAVMFALYFLVSWGYHIYLETCRQGRTPGKRMAGIQVVTTDGGPLAFRNSLLRNILRIADSLPTMYVVGSLFHLFTSRGQRIGDLAAGTIVVRTRGNSYQDEYERVKKERIRYEEKRYSYSNDVPPKPPIPPAMQLALNQMQLSPQEEELILNFCNRAEVLDKNKREQIAYAIAKRICEKHRIPASAPIDAETLLRLLVEREK